MATVVWDAQKRRSGNCFLIWCHDVSPTVVFVALFPLHFPNRHRCEMRKKHVSTMNWQRLESVPSFVRPPLFSISIEMDRNDDRCFSFFLLYTRPLLMVFCWAQSRPIDFLSLFGRVSRLASGLDYISFRPTQLTTCPFYLSIFWYVIQIYPPRLHI